MSSTIKNGNKRNYNKTLNRHKSDKKYDFTHFY